MIPFKKLLTSFATCVALGAISSASATAHEIPDCSVNCPAPLIQMALLLDTSNSMDGLIDQTKSQLWMLVNELGETSRHGITPKIELALYEYGNTNISVSKGYIRQVMSLTTDLDGVSEKLFALKTQGGQEYAGQVISTAIDELEWTDDPSAMKLVIIAGNEPFTQGPVHYESACAKARKKGILIDTIHCGNERTGIDTMWKAGADCGGGIYMTIDQDEVAEYVPSPYDDDILKLNQKLNQTYFGFGAMGAQNKMRQETQDNNARSMGFASSIARAKSKSSKLYDNSSWDLVDAYKKNKSEVLKLETDQLPEELKELSVEERETFIRSKVEEREEISKKISELEALRDQHVREEKIKMSIDNADEGKTIENVLINAVLSQAGAFGLK